MRSVARSAAVVGLAHPVSGSNVTVEAAPASPEGLNTHTGPIRARQAAGLQVRRHLPDAERRLGRRHAGVQVVEQRVHGRVETVLLAQLQGQALAHDPVAAPGRDQTAGGEAGEDRGVRA